MLRFDALASAVLLGVLLARALMPETFEALDLGLIDGVDGTGPTPAGTTVLDGVLLAFSAVIFWRRPVDPRRAPWFWIGTSLLVTAVCVSTLVAGDKRAAANAGANLVATILAGAALFRTLNSDALTRFALAAVIATGCAMGVKCISQRTGEFQDTLEQWQQQKQSLIERGYASDDPMLVNFERRIRSAEAYAYHFHPNVAGSMLMMCVLAAAGFAAAAWAARSVDPAAAGRAGLCAAASVVLIAIGLVLTGSKGAMVAGAIGLSLLGLLLWNNARGRSSAARLVAILAVAYALGIAGITALGIARGTLPGSSLAFRWHYWTAAAEAFRSAPLTGIGRENFTDAFVRYKDAASVEEVRDPHNLWVSLLVELGPLGLIAGAILLMVCFAAAARAKASGPPGPAHLPPSAAVVTVVTLAAVHAAFSGLPLSNPSLAFVWLIELVGLWIVALAAITWTSRVAGVGHGSTYLTAGALAACGASMVHNLIDFALLTPAGLALFAVVAACASARPVMITVAGGRGCASSGATRYRPPAAAIAVGILLIAHTVMNIAPQRSTSPEAVASRDIPDAIPPEVAGALAEQQQRTARDPFDAHPPLVVGRTALQVACQRHVASADALALLRFAEHYGVLAQARNPHAGTPHRLLAAIHQARALVLDRDGKQTDAADACRAAAAEWDVAVDYYPTNPRTRISAAAAWHDVWRRSSDAAAADTAKAHLRQALAIDATRKPEETTRLSAVERETIGRLMGDLERS